MVTTMNAPARPTAEPSTQTAYLIVDTESVPDARLVRLTKYPGENCTDDEAVAMAQAEAREKSWNNSDFLPVSFQVPVSVCVARVAADYTLTKLTCLDAPHFRPAEIVRQFWGGLERLEAKLVTFNGRCFDLPLMELAACRYGVAATNYFHRSRHRYNGGAIDLLEFFTNFGAYRLVGGLNVLAKMLGLPGKMDVCGQQVYEMYRAGQFQEINDYCMCDTLDTYFVFLRTRVMIGEMKAEREAELIAQTRDFLTERSADCPALRQYLDNWKMEPPWP